MAWDLLTIVPGILRAYTNTIPTAIFFGVLWGILTIGMWRRNRSTKLVSIVMIIISPFIMSSNAGLMIGIPAAEVMIGMTLLAAGLAGVILSLIKS